MKNVHFLGKKEEEISEVVVKRIAIKHFIGKGMAHINGFSHRM